MIILIKKIFKKQNLIILITGFLFLSLVLLGYFYILTYLPEFNSLRVNFLNVGQGDSILIQTPQGQTILIDGGADKSLIFKLDKYIPFFKRKIDYLILTHPDQDHITGLIEVLKRYKIGQVFESGSLSNINSFKKWQKIKNDKNIKSFIIKAPFNINLEKDLNLKFLWPTKTLLNQSQENNFSSIVFLLDYKDHEFLFTGDADKRAEQFIMDKYENLHADVLKAGHHGSKFSSSLEFLKRVLPKFFIISVGENNFGHPHFRVLKNAQAVKAKILQTKNLGDIIFFTKNNQLLLKTNSLWKKH